MHLLSKKGFRAHPGTPTRYVSTTMVPHDSYQGCTPLA